MKPHPTTNKPLSPVVLTHQELSIKFQRSVRRIFGKNPETEIPLPNLKILAKTVCETLSNPIQETCQHFTDTLNPNTLQTLKTQLLQMTPELDPALAYAFAKDMGNLNREKLIVEYLATINQEILTIEDNLKKSPARALQYARGPGIEKSEGWMEAIKKIEELTKNPYILRFITKTKERIKENLPDHTALALKKLGLYPSTQLKPSYNHPLTKTPIENIPKERIQDVQRIAKSLETLSNPLRNPLLIAARLLLFGAPPNSLSQLNPVKEKMREASNMNIKEGKSRMIKATHSMDPIPKKLSEQKGIHPPKNPCDLQLGSI